MIKKDKDRVTIEHLTVNDQALAHLLSSRPEVVWEETIERALEVGARSLLSSGYALDINDLNHRLQTSVEEAVGLARLTIEELLNDARNSLEERLDPDSNDSLLGGALNALGGRSEQAIERVESLLGAGGSFERQIAAALDPSSVQSPFGRLAEKIEGHMREMRDVIVGQKARADEIERSTVKGFEYEDTIEASLRTAASSYPGAIVERTSRTSGSLLGEALVGDFVVTFRSGMRVVVEAKNQRSLSLTGVLEEMDRAMDNRGAAAAICVSAQPAYPQEVGDFNVYGDRILVVDDGEGTLLAVALRWAEAQTLRNQLPAKADLDLVVLNDRLQRLRNLGQSFSNCRRSLSDIGTSVGQVRDTIDKMRTDLLALVDDVAEHIRPPGEVVSLNLQVG